MPRRDWVPLLLAAVLSPVTFVHSQEGDQFLNLKGIAEVSIVEDMGVNAFKVLKPGDLRGQAVAILSTKLKTNPDPNFLPRVRVYAELAPCHCESGCAMTLIVVKTVVEDRVTHRGRELVLPLWQWKHAKCYGKCDVKEVILAEVCSQAHLLLDDWLKAQSTELVPKPALPPPPQPKKTNGPEPKKTSEAEPKKKGTGEAKK